jgi:hypothetical protein
MSDDTDFEAARKRREQSELTAFKNMRSDPQAAAVAAQIIRAKGIAAARKLAAQAGVTLPSGLPIAP